jgi:magnesium transporter
MGTTRASRRKKVGLSPGTPVYLGEVRSHAIGVAVLDYGQETLREHSGLGTARPPAEGCLDVRWVDVDGVHDVSTVTALGEAFQLHPLLVEDVLNVGSRTKLEEYEQYLFMVFKAFQCRDEPDGGFQVVPEQISLVLGRSWVLTFQELPEDTFDTVRARIRNARGRIRKLQADYLAYAVLDATVDRYFDVLERIHLAVEELERKILLEDPDRIRDLPSRIHRLRAQLQMIRKHVMPLAGALGTLQRSSVSFVQKDTTVFLRDVADHVAQVVDQIDGLGSNLTNLLDTHIAFSNQKIGEITKVLTVVTAVFIPLTFVVGVYGMNFRYMPELEWRYGYFEVWGLMATLTLGLLLYFRHRKWL